MPTNDNSLLTSNSWLLEATRALDRAGIGTARLDALVLLEDSTGKDRSWLLAHPELELVTQQVNELNKKVAQRAAHTPLAYIREQTEFYGRTFYVDLHVLEPRPESETLIDLLKNILIKDSFPFQPCPFIADIGTGSGALAITAKLEVPAARIYAVDIDKNCLEIAKKNAARHKTDIHFCQGNLLLPLKGTSFNFAQSILLCNLPYVPDAHEVNQAALAEPRLAIFGGIDGLDLYRKMFNQIDSLSQKPQIILTESLPFQHEALATLAHDHGYTTRGTQDFIQEFILSTSPR